VFQKEKGKDRVVKSGIKKHPETDEPGKISIYLSVGERILHERGFCLSEEIKNSTLLAKGLAKEQASRFYL
jgi:hypothetical protein